MKELLPCPFCGEDNFLSTQTFIEEVFYPGYKYKSEAFCGVCFARTIGYGADKLESERSAIKSWNRRSNDNSKE